MYYGKLMIVLAFLLNEARACGQINAISDGLSGCPQSCHDICEMFPTCGSMFWPSCSYKEMPGTETECPYECTSDCASSGGGLLVDDCLF